LEGASVIDVVNAGSAMEKLSIIGMLSVALGVTFYMLKDKKTLDEALTRIATAMEQNNKMIELTMDFHKEILQVRLEEIRNKQDRILEELLRKST